MCWTSKNEPTKLVATKDIECYKNFSLTGITFEQKSIFKIKFGKKKNRSDKNNIHFELI